MQLKRNVHKCSLVDSSSTTRGFSTRPSNPPPKSESWFDIQLEKVKYVLESFQKLGFETYTVGKLIFHGGARTRGQYKLIERNSKDLAQLIPFTVFAVLPGAFFVLPVVIKLFPGFMPSVFHGKTYKSEQVLVMTQARRKMREDCNLLFDSLTVILKDKDLKGAAILSKITNDVFGNDATDVSDTALCESLLTLSRSFIDNVHWDQFTLKHRRLMTSHFGTPAFLFPERKLSHLLTYIVRDDMVMISEDVDNLSYEELIESSSRRGLRVINLTKMELQHQLRLWHKISMHISWNSPELLCIASIAFFHRDLDRLDRKYDI
eukprot:CFRG6332T1